MPVETARLCLRPLEASDIDTLVALWTDPDVTRYMGEPRAAEKVRQLLQDELRTGRPYAQLLDAWSVVEK